MHPLRSFFVPRGASLLALAATGLLGCSGESTTLQATDAASSSAPTAPALPPTPAAAPLPASAALQIEHLLSKKRTWSTLQAKLDSGLVFELERRADPDFARALPAFRAGPALKPHDRVELDVEAQIDAALLSRVEALGGKVISSVPKLGALRLELPLANVQELAAEPHVRYVARALGYTLNKVDTSEGDVAHRAATARSSHSLSGSGVKVGVLSDGVDSLSARVTSGDLPSGVTVVSGQAGAGDEGTAMLEIVYDLAPGASLMFATANGGEAQFAQNIRALRDLGAKVIVDDVYYYGESTFQDDVVVQAIDDVTSTGVVYLSAAGNGGNLAHANSSVWEGDFALSATTRPAVNTIETQPTPLHDFTSGQNYDAVTADPTGYITLEWSDPSSASTNDYDLFLLDSSLTNVLAASTNMQAGTQPPFEYIDSTTNVDTNNRLVVARFSGEARFLRVNLNSGGKLALGTVGQISGHAAGTNALAVAAVNVTTAGGGAFVGGSTNPVEYFSADGPRRMFYLADGTPITPGNLLSTGGTLRQKPDIAAADRVSTSTPGFKPFAGTSAAAPHAAAITALLWQQHPTYTVPQIKALLTSTALDIETTGFDKTAGNGLVMADRATAGCGVLSDGTACDDGNPCTTGDSCSGGSCVGGASLSCSDSNACTDDSCNPATGCVHTNNTASCSDGDPCTVSESCHSGVCGGGSAKTCTASDACHLAGTCTTGVGCSNPSAPDGTSCPGGSCMGGTCVPAGSGGTGGSSSGGSGGTAGRGAGGTATGGDAGAIGDAGQGGEAGTTSASGGTGAVSAGGTAGSTTSSAGSSTGGAATSGGAPNQAGSAGSAGSAGGPSNGGYAGSLPSAGASGKANVTAGNGGQPPSTTLQNLDKGPIKGGCSCSVPEKPHDAPWLAAAGGLALIAVGRRRSPRRRR